MFQCQTSSQIISNDQNIDRFRCKVIVWIMQNIFLFVFFLFHVSIKFHYEYDYTSFAVCPPNHFGPNCANCQHKCQSCDPITGKCTQCQSSLYGEYCNLTCPVYCLDLICNHETGACNGCKNGFKGKNCGQETTSLIVSSGIKLI